VIRAARRLAQTLFIGVCDSLADHRAIESMSCHPEQVARARRPHHIFK